MNASVHPLVITTLATWLSVLLVAGVGWWVPQLRDGRIELAEPSGVMQADVFLGHMEEMSEGSTGAPAVVEPVALESTALAYALPPAMPEPLVTNPLPEIPEPQVVPPPTPDPVADTTSTATATPTNPATTATATPANPAPATRRPSAGNPRVGAASNSSRQSGSGSTASASRMSAGKMPAPRYPLDARRRGQEGTVVVEFTVDASGQVIAAETKQASPWDSLNREALRAVRSWKFPPGDVMKMQRPIVFKLR